jgi:hypothetical protein
MEQYAAQDTRSSGQPQAPTTTTSQNPKVSEISLVEDMGFSSSALDKVTVGNTGFTEVSMIEEIFAVEKRKATRSGTESDGSDRRIAKKVAQDQDAQQPGQPEPVEQVSSQTEGGEAGKEAMEGRVQRSKEEEKKMEMLVARREVEKKAVRETENKRVEQEENEMVEEKRVEDGEKRMGVLVVDKGVEEENAVDGQRSGRKGAELLVKKKGMEAEEKEKEELGVRGTVMHGVHDSALFYSMVLLQFIVEWGHSMLVVWGILKSTCWHRGWLVSTVGVG